MSWTWTSLGGCQTVTGSQHIISTPKGDIMLECGLFQGRRKHAWQRNQKLPVNLDAIKAVVISHAHIDHSGRLPYLIKKGYCGPIYCTPNTAQLLEPILHDSAHIMHMDYKYLKRKNRQVLEPFSTIEDVRKVNKLIEPIDYHEPTQILPGIWLSLSRSSHILGSALINIYDNDHNILFTGDLGNDPSPFHKKWEPPSGVKHLFIESTYGGRSHKPYAEAKEDLRLEIKRVQEKNGRLIIPAFAMERTQMLVSLIHCWIQTKEIEPIDIYVDSPLGIRLSRIYEVAQDEFSVECQLKHSNPFKSPWLHVMESVDDSMSILQKQKPYIIISSSGMCEGGRILHHLKNNCQDPNNTLLIVGFQAQSTLGRRLVERRPFIKILGQEYPLKARVKSLNGFSSHADQDDLTRFVKTLGSSVKSINIVHGETKQSHEFKEHLFEQFKHMTGKIQVVQEDESIDLQ